MDIRLLGPLEVWHEGRQLDLGGPKRRALLAVLALHSNEVVRTDRLVDELWGERAPRNAVGALHNHVSRLRKEIGVDTVVTRPWGYVLRADPDELDVARFERLVADADALPAGARAAALSEALSLWRGRALADLEGEPALQIEIGRLEELRIERARTEDRCRPRAGSRGRADRGVGGADRRAPAARAASRAADPRSLPRR
ncbi:MAG: winged helix-turn-helix domain-containing protein [Actinobacteria bacterium]|nr:winged helix-turn-helix domain-containing protein [Actinomycetota bacterium]